MQPYSSVIARAITGAHTAPEARATHLTRVRGAAPHRRVAAAQITMRPKTRRKTRVHPRATAHITHTYFFPSFSRVSTPHRALRPRQHARAPRIYAFSRRRIPPRRLSHTRTYRGHVRLARAALLINHICIEERVLPFDVHTEDGPSPSAPKPGSGDSSRYAGRGAFEVGAEPSFEHHTPHHTHTHHPTPPRHNTLSHERSSKTHSSWLR